MTITRAESEKRTYTKSETRRQAILDAAVEVFCQGSHQGSLRDVARRAGISQTGLLHHYPTKDTLVVAVLARRDDEVRRSFPAGITGLAALEATITVIARNARTPELVRLHTSLAAEATSPDHPAHAHFQERYRWIIDFFTETFQAVEADGLLAPNIAPRSAARHLCALLDGLQVQWLLTPDDVDMATEVHTHLQALVTVPL